MSCVLVDDQLALVGWILSTGQLGRVNDDGDLAAEFDSSKSSISLAVAVVLMLTVFQTDPASIRTHVGPAESPPGLLFVAYISVQMEPENVKRRERTYTLEQQPKCTVATCCRLDEFDELFCEALASPLPGDSGATAGSNFASTHTAYSRDSGNGGSHGIRSASTSTSGSRSSLSSCAV